MKGKGQASAILIIVIFLLLGVIGLLVYQNLQLQKLIQNNTRQSNKTEAEMPEILPSQPETTSTPSATPKSQANIPTGWLTYKNEKYSFQISYPPTYKALTDKNNLYGWPKAVVLIYSGGQSYDLPIEVWNSVAEYQAKYKNEPNLTVKKIGDKYITLVNANQNPEVDQIISTFSITE